MIFKNHITFVGLLSILMSMSIRQVVSECCPSLEAKDVPWCHEPNPEKALCQDCTPPVKLAETVPSWLAVLSGYGDMVGMDLYCGVGPCNTFGCNCDKGCRKKPDGMKKFKEESRPITEDMMFKMMDVNSDGQLGFDEIRARKPGFPFELFMMFDADRNEAIDFNEFNHAGK